MKVVVLGGTGHMGRLAVRELGRTPDVKALTIAARNVDRTRQLAAEIGDHVQAVSVDAGNPQSLIDVFRGHDVVAGALGPFYLYEALVAQAAIEAGVQYVSICDDHDAMESVLKLDPMARTRGVTILSGVGWTPGLTNIMAKKGAALLDTAKEVHIAWVGSSADSEGFAVMLHTMHIFTGKVPTFSKGMTTWVQAGTGRRAVRFPEPLGVVNVYHVGHPEPVTLPRFMPGLTDVTLRGGLTEPFLNWLSIAISRVGLTATHARKERLARLFKPILPVLEKIGAPAHPLSGAHVEVRGYKGGKPARVELAVTDHMVNLTSLPLVVATLMLGRKELNQPGVMVPEAEGGPDPDRFLQALTERGMKIRIGAVDVQPS